MKPDEGLLPDEMCAECGTFVGENCKRCHFIMSKVKAKLQPELDRLNERIKELEGLIPTCANCIPPEAIAQAKADAYKDLGLWFQDEYVDDFSILLYQVVQVLKSGKSPRESGLPLEGKG